MTAENRRGASTFVDGWRMSVGTLTAVPITPPSRIDRRIAGHAMLLAPLAALPVAAVWASFALVAGLIGLLPSVFAAVAIAGTTLATRAMHLDGLADTADGLSASYDRDRALAVMKTGDVGPSGAAAIALVLFLQIAASASLFVLAPAGPAAAVVLGVVALCASRQVLALVCTPGTPAARPGGLGATVAGSVPLWAAATALGALAIVGSTALAAVGGAWWAAPLVVLTATLSGTATTRRCVRRFGGITGDVLGAVVEISFAVGLCVAALALSVPMPAV